jgi:hypothetical protein
MLHNLSFLTRLMSSLGMESSMSSILWPKRFRLIPGVDLRAFVPPAVLDRVAGEDAEGTKGAAVIEAQVGGSMLDLEVVLPVVLGVTPSMVLFEYVWAKGEPIGKLAEIVCNGRWIGPGAALS